MDIILNRIKTRRKALGYSYQNLADKTNISKSTLQRYETGSIKRIPLDKLENLATALHTTSSYLMGWEDNSIRHKDITEAAEKILNHYGAEAQKRQLVEEMAELTKALNKEWRFNMRFISGNSEEIKKKFIEGTADVLVCFEQMLILYDCADEIYDAMRVKPERTLKRINE